MGVPGKRTPAGEVEAMVRLRCLGWSVRRVARECDVDTKTVMRCAPLRVVVARLAAVRLANEAAEREAAWAANHRAAADPPDKKSSGSR